MTRRKLTTTLGLASITALAPSSKAQSDAERALLKIENEWYNAFLQSDAATLNRIEGEDFIVITPMMPVEQFKPLGKGRSFPNRSDAVKSRLAQFKRSLEQPQIRLIGDAAIINGVIVTTGPDEKSQKDYYTSVWTKRNGAWQIINAQFTTVP